MKILGEFSKTKSLIATNIIGPHTKSRIITWHSQRGRKHHDQIDYIITQKRFTTSFNKNKTRIFQELK